MTRVSDSLIRYWREQYNGMWKVRSDKLCENYCIRPCQWLYGKDEVTDMEIRDLINMVKGVIPD